MRNSPGKCITFSTYFHSRRPEKVRIQAKNTQIQTGLPVVFANHGLLDSSDSMVINPLIASDTFDFLPPLTLSTFDNKKSPFERIFISI